MGLPGTPNISGKNINSKHNIKNMSYGMQKILGIIEDKKRPETYAERLISKGPSTVIVHFHSF